MNRCGVPGAAPVTKTLVPSVLIARGAVPVPLPSACAVSQRRVPDFAF